MSTFSLHAVDTSPVKAIRSFQVAVQVSEYSQTEDGKVIITADCVTDKEVDFAIDHLIDSLQKVRRAAKAKLAKNGKA
jgi:hypothetical protein